MVFGCDIRYGTVLQLVKSFKEVRNREVTDMDACFSFRPQPNGLRRAAEWAAAEWAAAKWAAAEGWVAEPATQGWGHAASEAKGWGQPKAKGKTSAETVDHTSQGVHITNKNSSRAGGTVLLRQQNDWTPCVYHDKLDNAVISGRSMSSGSRKIKCICGTLLWCCEYLFQGGWGCVN